METDDIVAAPQAEGRSFGIPVEVQVLRAYRSQEMNVRESRPWSD